MAASSAMYSPERPASAADGLYQIVLSGRSFRSRSSLVTSDAPRASVVATMIRSAGSSCRGEESSTDLTAIWLSRDELNEGKHLRACNPVVDLHREAEPPLLDEESDFPGADAGDGKVSRGLPEPAGPRTRGPTRGALSVPLRGAPRTARCGARVGRGP